MYNSELNSVGAPTLTERIYKKIGKKKVNTDGRNE